VHCKNDEGDTAHDLYIAVVDDNGCITHNTYIRKEGYGCTVQDVYIAGNKTMNVLGAMRTLAGKTTMNVLCTMHATPSKMRRRRIRRRDSADEKKGGAKYGVGMI